MQKCKNKSPNLNANTYKSTKNRLNAITVNPSHSMIHFLTLSSNHW